MKGLGPVMSVLLAGACMQGRAQWTAPPFQPEPAQVGQADLREVLGLVCPPQADASVESAIRGHFLKPDSDDLRVVLYGCHPQAGNFGAAFLLTHSTSGWFVSAAEGLPAGPCRKIPGRSGRDGLVCFTVTSLADRQNARLTFGYVPGETADLVGAFDNTGGACDAPRRLVVQSAIQEVKFVPGADGKLTLRITASCRRGPLSARSLKACASGTGFEDISPAVPFRTFRIDYTFNGETFSLTAASRPLKQAYESCSADVK